jgi:cbb3-type cytochrome oxidase maturation protein
MSVIILLLIASLSVALLFLGAFIWGVRTKQFDDGFAPPLRILFDDVPAEAEEIPEQSKPTNI